MLLPVYRIWKALMYLLNSDNHAHTCVIAPENGFGSANRTDIATFVAITLYFCY